MRSAFIGLVLAASAIAQLVPAVALRPLMRDVMLEVGVTFRHHASTEKRFIVESMSGGVDGTTTRLDDVKANQIIEIEQPR